MSAPPRQVELVTVGTELLLGFTLDRNSVFLGQALAAIGLPVARRTSVGDDPLAIRDAIDTALTRTGIVVTTGGLGPTRDDITRQTVADLLQMPLEFDASVWQAIVERVGRFGRLPAESNRVQALVPRGGTVLPNQWGTAPGLWLEGARGIVVMLPGVPTEMRMLAQHEALPRLARYAGAAVVRSAMLRTHGIPEATLAERIGVLEDELAPLSLAYLPDLGGVDLRLTSWHLPETAAVAALRQGLDRLHRTIGEGVYGEGEIDLAEVVLAELRARRQRLAVAESCTGGLLGGRLTEIPGASDVFVGGVVAYHNDVKREWLGVGADLLATHGAVSAEIAEAMAREAARRFGVEAAVSVTGIAGPGGGSDAKPVGTVWFGYSVAGTSSTSRSQFVGTRAEIRARATQTALAGLWRRIRGTETP